MSATYQVVDAEPSHLDVLVEFNAALASETEDKALNLDTLTQGVRAALSDPQRGFYLVALDEHGKSAGSLMVTREWSDWRNGWFWWIQSVYVRAEHRRRGVYARLYEEVQARARARDDVYGFRLYVELENHPAQKTYARLGMDECDYKMFEASLRR